MTRLFFYQFGIVRQPWFPVEFVLVSTQTRGVSDLLNLPPNNHSFSITAVNQSLHEASLMIKLTMTDDCLFFSRKPHRTMTRAACPQVDGYIWLVLESVSDGGCLFLWNFKSFSSAHTNVRLFHNFAFLVIIGLNHAPVPASSRYHHWLPHWGKVHACIYQNLSNCHWKEAWWWSHLPDSLWCFSRSLCWSLANLQVQEKHQAETSLVGSSLHQSLCNRRCSMLHCSKQQENIQGLDVADTGSCEKEQIKSCKYNFFSCRHSSSLPWSLLTGVASATCCCICHRLSGPIASMWVLSGATATKQQSAQWMELTARSTRRTSIL